MILIFEHTETGKKPVACCQDNKLEKVVAALKCGLITSEPYNELKFLQQKVKQIQEKKHNFNIGGVTDEELRNSILALQKLANLSVDREIGELKKKINKIESGNRVYSWEVIKYYDKLPNSGSLLPDELEQGKQAEAQS